LLYFFRSNSETVLQDANQALKQANESLIGNIGKLSQANKALVEANKKLSKAYDMLSQANARQAKVDELAETVKG
jgi:chromosome segregation ATPase